MNHFLLENNHESIFSKNNEKEEAAAAAEELNGVIAENNKSLSLIDSTTECLSNKSNY